MHKKFEINKTKIKGGCESERKAVTHKSKSDLPLGFSTFKNRFLEKKANIFVFPDVSLFMTTMLEADHESGSLTCPLPIPSVPSSISMAESPDQPILMCPGSNAQYICNAGGIDVREDDNTKSSYDIQCKSDLTYAIPDSDSEWPQCVDRLDCPIPDSYDPYVFKSSWKMGDSLTPPFTIQYECFWPNKKILLKTDLENLTPDSNMVTILEVTCLINGTYD